MITKQLLKDKGDTMEFNVEINHLSKTIGKKKIIKDLSLNIKKEKYLDFSDLMELGKQRPLE